MAIVSVANMVVWLITPIAFKSFSGSKFGLYLFLKTSLNSLRGRLLRINSDKTMASSMSFIINEGAFFLL